MIIGLIVFIFSCVGIYGYFNEIFILTYIVTILCVIEEFIGIGSEQQKGFFAIPLSIMFGIGAKVAGKSFLLSSSIFMCFENVITFIFGVVLFVIIGNKMNKAEKKIEETQENINYEKAFFEKLEEKNKEYDEEKNKNN